MKRTNWGLLLGIAGLGVVLLAGAAWMWRGPLVLAVLSHVGKPEVAPNRPIVWAEGPATPAAPSTPAAATAAATTGGGQRPPNIIFILADDLGINDISAFGGGLAGGRVKTPAIDALAAGGAVFTNGYAGGGTCAPSRAILMTGRYPTRTGFEFTPTPDGMGPVISLLSGLDRSGLPPIEYHRDTARSLPPFELQGLPGSEVTVAETLKTAGYHTIHIGKWHTGLGPEFGPNAQGFDESLLMASGLHLREDDPRAVNARLDFDPIDRFLWARMQWAASWNEGPWFEPGGYLADWWTDEAVKAIRANRNRPFFLHLAHWSVHSPLQATREDYDAVVPLLPASATHRERVYAAMIRALDRSVGRIMAALKAEGLAENTLVVFSSDNGAPGYVGIEGVNAPYRGFKLTLFEGGIRVPMILNWPARIAAGTTLEAPAGHIDLMPTFAAAAGAPLPGGVAIDGIDLLPQAAGRAPAPQRALFWRSGPYRVVREGDWKLQLIGRPRQTLLFNLKDDPTERRDLSAANPAKVAELTALIEAQERGRKPPLYPYAVEGPALIDRTLDQGARPGDVFVYWPN